MNGSEDRRVRKTKRVLEECLAKLLREKPLKSITVAELADINRGTFYLHYRDVYDMAEQIQNDFFEKFNRILDEHRPGENSELLLPLLDRIFELLAENADMAECMLGKNGDAAFIDRLKNNIKERCFSYMYSSFRFDADAGFDYFYNFIESGCIGVFKAWLAGGMKETPQEMALLVEKMILNGYAALR